HPAGAGAGPKPVARALAPERRRCEAVTKAAAVEAVAIHARQRDRRHRRAQLASRPGALARLERPRPPAIARALGVWVTHLFHSLSGLFAWALRLGSRSRLGLRKITRLVGNGCRFGFR